MTAQPTTLSAPEARRASAAGAPRTAFETLCGRIAFGDGAPPPALYKAPQSKSWPTLLRGEHCDIAIDGWFVLDDRLLLGRAADEQRKVVDAIERDLDGFLRRLDNGFFNLVVHDRRSGTTRIANDRFGGLPIFLLDEPGALAFAATHDGLEEIAATPPAHDPVGLAELYWFGYQLGERTAWQGVTRLAPGSVLTIDGRDGRRTLAAYEPPPAERMRFETPAAAADYLAEAMRASLAALRRDDARYAVKLSAGMDSRFIAAAWPDDALRAYTFGHPDASEITLATRLAKTLGLPQTIVPLRGDFYSTLHAPLFGRQGLMEFFHQALLPEMQRDGIDFVLDGLAGDVLVGGLTLKRAQSLLNQALGRAPDLSRLAGDREAIARYLIGLIKVPDGGYRPLSADAQAHVDAHWDAMLADMVGEVERAERVGRSVEEICQQVMFNNRGRRMVSLQGTVCRPEVETLYPFLDRRFLATMRCFPPEWIASKRLYVELYTRHFPQVRRVPSTYSMLPFSVSPALHLGGRVVRYALERAGSAITQRSGARLNPWVADGMQWRRWLAFEPRLQQAAHEHLQRSERFVRAESERALQRLKRKAVFSGTRFMYTASYLSYFSRR